MDEQSRAQRLAELQKQRAELDKIIQELAAEEAQLASTRSTTNIPYTPEFAAACAAVPAPNLQAVPPGVLLDLKVFVNRKCNQVSADYAHTAALVREILPHRDNAVFQELFARKLIEQGRAQVAARLDSHAPYSYILKELQSPATVAAYLRLLVSRRGTAEELRGIYAVYFGYLNLSEDVAGCWAWLAAVLNSIPGEATGHVLEAFLSICGEMLCEKCGRFPKLVRYIDRHFLPEISSEAVRVRMRSLLDACKKRLNMS